VLVVQVAVQSEKLRRAYLSGDFTAAILYGEKRADRDYRFLDDFAAVSAPSISATCAEGAKSVLICLVGV